MENTAPEKELVNLKKPHPCGGAQFEIIRKGPVVTLRCVTCGSLVRLPREKFERSAKNSAEK